MLAFWGNIAENVFAICNFLAIYRTLIIAFSLKRDSTSSIIRTSFIRHSIFRPLGQIIIYDITNTFPVNVGQ